jgi:hypothetical protein
MSVHIKSMLHDDPDRPSWQAFKRWKQIFTCTQCLEQSNRPPRRTAHPHRTNDGSFLPGEFIIADGSGAYKFETINGYTQHFVFSDFCSKARFAFPSKTKSASELVVLLKQFSADSRVAILKFQGDDDIINSEEVRKWARDSTPQVQLSLSPPHVAQPNGAAERCIAVSESIARGAKSRSGSGSRLWPLIIVDMCRSLNIRPHASLPRGRSPLSMWPDMPYQHVSLPPRVWGCRMHSLELDRTDRSTAAGRRSRPLIYVGVSQRARAYLGYDVDSDTLLTVSSDLARFDESVFPLKDMLLQGEAFASDYAVDVDGWRAVALLPAAAVNDMQLAEFLTGKQILFRVPSTVFPQESGNAVGTWDMRVLRPSVSRGRDVPKTVSVEMHFENFSGDIANLPASMRSFQSSALTSLVPISLAGSNGGYECVRGMLKSCYPSDALLADVSLSSSRISGALPLPPAVVDTRISFARATLPRWHDPHAAALLVVAAMSSLLSPVVDPPVPVKIGFCPRSRKQALAHSSSPLWHSAEQSELAGLRRRVVYDRVQRSSVPRDVRILGTKYDYKDKSSGPKARCCVRGDQQFPYPDSADVFVPTPPPEMVRTFFAHAAQTRRIPHLWDCTQAFTQSDDLTGPPVYVHPPPGAEDDPTIVWRLRKPLYGLAAAPRAWFNTLTGFLQTQGWSPACVGEDTLYSKTVDGHVLLILYHVDDILFSCPPEADAYAAEFKHTFFARFDGRDEGPVTRFLGMDVELTSGRIALSLSGMIHDLLEEYGLSDCNPASTPLDANSHLLAADQPRTPLPRDRIRNYQHLVGSLQFISTWTRPDISVACRELGKHLSNPGTVHEIAARRVLRYLRGTADLALIYSCSSEDVLRLISFADSDWASDPESRKSITGNLVMLSGGAISWRSKRQTGVATSSTAAEYVAASKCSDTLTWLRRLAAGMGFPQSAPTPMFEDNRGCRLLSENPHNKERTRHIDIARFNVREHVKQGVCRLVDCPTFDMHADPLTKALPGPSLARHRSVMLGHAPRTTPTLNFFALPRCVQFFRLRVASRRAA